MPGEYEAWERGNIRGLPTRYAGTEKDEHGNEHRVFEVADSEWGAGASETDAYRAKYLMWHQTYHRGVVDPRCTICKSEQEFKILRAPHDQNHRTYQSDCRFCQDARFFGRM